MHLWRDFEILPNWRCKISLENGLKRGQEVKCNEQNTKKNIKISKGVLS